MPAVPDGPSANVWGAELTSPTIVRHQGRLVLLAREVRRPTDTLYFQVFDPEAAIGGADAAAWNGWYRYTFPEAPPDPALPVTDLTEPSVEAAEELRPAGMDLVTVGPVVVSVSPSDAPFEVTSDDRHLYCFRPSTTGTLYLTRLVITPSKEDEGERQVTRYGMSPAWEVRYQRSGLRDVPLDDTDSASAVGLTGVPFFEPSIEVAEIAGAAPGRFSVARVPTGRPGLVAWYVGVSAADGVHLTRFDQTDGTLTDFTSPPVHYTPIAPTRVVPGGNPVPLTLSTTMAPDLLFCAEQDQVITETGDTVDLQRQGRLMLAVPVSGADLDSAMAIYDYCLGADGAISDLPAARQGVRLVDGTIEGGKFVPDTAAPEFPTQAQAADCVQVVDGLVVNQMLLGQVAPPPPAVDPVLYMGEDALVHLYYGGPPPSLEEDEITGWHGLVPGRAQAMVAQFDPRVSRLRIDVPWRRLVTSEQPDGAVHFTARQAGAIMAGATVEVRDATFAPAAPPASQADLCDVVLAYPPASGLPGETWVGVPREIAALVATLNGGATDDSADPTLGTGDRQYFDFDGTHPLVRLPLATGVLPGIEHAPRAGLATVRPTLPLKSVAATTAGGSAELRLTFTFAGGPDIVQVWSGLPGQTAMWASILDGAAAPDDYDYKAGTGSTLMFGLPTRADQVLAPLLLVPSGDDPDRASLEIAVRRSAHDPKLLDVDFTHTRLSCKVTDVPPDVDKFAAALRANADFALLKLAIDTTGVAGTVATTTTAVGALGLREATCLFDYWCPAGVPPTSTVPDGEVLAGRQGHTFTGGDGQRTRTTMVGFAASAEPSEAGVPAYIVNQAAATGRRVNRELGPPDATGAQVPRSGVWARQVAHNACKFTATDSAAVPVLGQGNQPTPRSARLRPASRFTIEAWAQPTGSDLQRLVTFSDQVTAVPKNAPRLDYRIGLDGQRIVAFGAYEKSPRRPDSSYARTAVHVGTSALPPDTFTWEVWVQPDAVAAPTGSPPPLGGIVQIDVPDQHNPALSVGLRADRRVVVAVSADGRSVTEHLSTGVVAAVDDDGVRQWTHLALVGAVDEGAGTWTLRLYLNAVLDATFTAVPLQSDVHAATITIGRDDSDGASVFGKLAQLRLWGIGRTVAEIRSSAFVTLDGREPGLLGYWKLTSIDPGPGADGHLTNAALRTGIDWNATVFKSRQPIDTTPDDFFLSIVASIGGLDPVKADALLATGRWNHLAIEFEAGGAIELNLDDARTRAGRYDWMTCAHSDSLVAGSAFAIDAWVIVPPGARPGGTLAGRWAWAEAPQDQSYRLRVTDEGELALDARLVTDDAKNPLLINPVSSGAKIADGQAHHVAVAFTSQTLSGGQTSRWTVTFYKDGNVVGKPVTGDQTRSSIELQSTQVAFMAGRGVVVPAGAKPQSIDSLSLFRGTIGRLRFWRVAAPVTDLFPERYAYVPRFGTPAGLVARWDFLEQSGQVVSDTIGANDGTLTSATPWRTLQATSEMAFYANGAAVGTTEPYKGTLTAPPASGFWLGAPPGGGVAGIAGDVAQVTLWDTLRSLETIQDQQYVPRTGGEPGMLAGWNFTPGSKDITDGDNDISPPVPAARIVPSTAPITNEGAFVRNVYGGRITELSQSTFDRVAAGSTVGVQMLTSRAPTAVVKRQFVFDANGSFSRPIHIGYVDLVWVGQVQTDPTLIGFIEGAPPVPSENLTRPYYLSPVGYLNYANTTQMTVLHDAAEQITYTSASKDTGSLDVKAALGIFGQRETTELNLIAVSSSAYYMKNTIQAQLAFQGKWGSDTNAAYDAKWSAAQRDSLGVRGDWEPYEAKGKDYLNEQVGRRFVPDNVGLALVESLTADLYAITFAGNSAALGTVVVPNPAIPPDRNLLLFPIDRQYTLAGSLDGKVGLVNAPGYKLADRARGSYFKPNEAYATAAWIERQNEQQRAYAQQFSPGTRGRSGDAGLDPAAANLPMTFETAPGGDGQVAIPHSGIVNRYVWSADGGLHSEAQAYTTASSRTFTGFRTIGVGGGVKGSGEFYVKLGWAWSLDVLGTHTVDVTVGATDVVSGGVSMDVSVVGESLLQSYDPKGVSPYGGTGTLVPGAAPGKVRQYRFMTFYLPPSEANATSFPNVVDPVWRQLSTDPAARALRELNADNPVWRVYHRVTYVERVPPPVASRPLFASATSLREPQNLEGNATLLRLVAESLDAGAPLTHVSIGAAVAAVMNPTPTGPGQYPVSVLERHLSWWRPFLDRARPAADGKTPDAAAAAELATLVDRVYDYVYAGYETGVLPVKEA